MHAPLVTSRLAHREARPLASERSAPLVRGTPWFSPRALLLSLRTQQQIRDVEQRRPVIEVPPIERFALNLEHAEDVAPLTVRDLIAQLVPDELVKERVLMAREARS